VPNKAYRCCFGEQYTLIGSFRLTLAQAATLLILLESGLASATEDISKDIATCAAKTGDLERTACYDEIARKNRLDSPQSVSTPIQGKGKWEVANTINPIDDTQTTALFLSADSGKSKWGEPIVLMVRCASKRTELFIRWNDYLGGEAQVLTRVGKEKASTTDWTLSTDSTASFYPGSPIPFIRTLLKHEQLVAQVTPYGDSPVTAIFDINGLRNAIQPLMENCNWSETPPPPKPKPLPPPIQPPPPNQAPKAIGVLTGELTKGEVRQSQLWLQELDFFYGTPNGERSIDLELAVRHYQSKKKLRQSGVLDRELMNLIQADILAKGN